MVQPCGKGDSQSFPRKQILFKFQVSFISHPSFLSRQVPCVAEIDSFYTTQELHDEQASSLSIQKFQSIHLLQWPFLIRQDEFNVLFKCAGYVEIEM